MAANAGRRFVFANQPYLEFASRPAAQAMGQPLAEVIGATVARDVEPLLARCFAGSRAEWEGRAAFRDLHPLIFANLRMPAMEGMALQAAMAARRPDPATRIVVMTGDLMAGPKLVGRDGAAGAPPLLEKPLGPAEVRTLLERLAAEGRL